MKLSNVVVAVVVLAAVYCAFAVDEKVPKDDENKDQNFLFQEAFGDTEVLINRPNETEFSGDRWDDEGISHRIQELQGALFQDENQTAEFSNESVAVQPGSKQSSDVVANLSTIVQPGTEESANYVVNTTTTVPSSTKGSVDDVASASTAKPITMASVPGGSITTLVTKPLNVSVNICRPPIWNNTNCNLKCFMDKQKEFMKCIYVSNKIQNLLLFSLGLKADVRVEYGVRNVTLEINIPL